MSRAIGGGPLRVLFTTCPAQGHFYPMVPLAWALRAAGHDVMVAAPKGFLSHVSEAGLSGAACASEYDMIEVMRPKGGSGPPRAAADPRQGVADTARGFARLAELALPGVLELVERRRPDVVVSESAELAGPAVASRFGIPWVEHRWGLGMRPELSETAQAAFRATAGGSALPVRTPPVLVVDACPPSLQHPDVPAGTVMSYVPYNGPAVLPEWLLWPAGRPVVCVTLGTVLPRYGRMEPLLHQVTTALDALDVQPVVAMHGDDAAALRAAGDLPKTVRAAQWLPLGLVLPACAAVVHHGGSGTTMAAVVAGVPQVVLPHFADQFANAERVAAVGAGIRIDPPDLSEAAIRAAVSTLRRDGKQAEIARALAEESAAQPAPADIARLLTQRVAAAR